MQSSDFKARLREADRKPARLSRAPTPPQAGVGATSWFPGSHTKDFVKVHWGFVFSLEFPLEFVHGIGC